MIELNDQPAAWEDDPKSPDARVAAKPLTQPQLQALRSVQARSVDCETLATRITRRLRMLGLLTFGEANGRVAHVLTDAGRLALEGERVVKRT